jgi:acyl-CoA reductase-like NAD-dependent aldehyde dehydrogenase
MQSALVQSLRKSFNTHRTKSFEWRKAQLNALSRLVVENSDELCNALKLDLNKPEHEALGKKRKKEKRRLAIDLSQSSIQRYGGALGQKQHSGNTGQH